MNVNSLIMLMVMPYRFFADRYNLWMSRVGRGVAFMPDAISGSRKNPQHLLGNNMGLSLFGVQ
jgi:hypothetical protein